MTGEILHFGTGNFFRAHLAWYTWRAGGWRITGISLRSPAIRDGLAAQNFHYTLVVDGLDGTKFNTIDVLDDVWVAPEDPARVQRAVASERFSIISATVTEKGYHLGSDQKLDLADSDIASDLKGGAQKTLIGFLAHGLALRKTPVTVLSCDNRTENGRALETAIRDFAGAAELSIDWDLVSFPNAMVDRITPATTSELLARVDAQGLNDRMPVPTEAFSEWVIEDRFVSDRPDWQTCGAQLVADVAPHELRKLRMLNGAHSYLAYAGILRGHDFVHEAIADPVLRKGAIDLMREAAETLPDSVRGQAVQYGRELVVRFENPALCHRLRQIAMDGTQKIPYRWLETLASRQDMGKSSTALIRAVAAWIAFCQHETMAGRALQDPQATRIAEACDTDAPEEALARLIGIDPAQINHG